MFVVPPRVRVIDLFSGPGGLSEGFVSVGKLTPESGDVFDVVLAYENDPHAVRTLRFRKFYHACRNADRLPDYFRAFVTQPTAPEKCLAGETRDIYDSAANRVRPLTLGRSSRDEVSKQVRAATSGSPWVLLGGPPCQAYSLIGRARNRGIADYDPAADERQTLYEEYLHVLATAAPEVFVLENVKGLLSATVENRWIFGKMVADLAAPGHAFGLTESSVRYRLYSLVDGSELDPGPGAQIDMLSPPAEVTDLRKTVVRMEQYGAPQARHRVLICGVRSDLRAVPRPLQRSAALTPLIHVIADLPPLRSRFTDQEDAEDAWVRFVRTAPLESWRGQLLAATKNCRGPSAFDRLARRVRRAPAPAAGPGGALVRRGAATNRTSAVLDEAAAADVKRAWRRLWRWWYRGDLGRQKWYANHESRGHMAEDVLRYMFAASYAWLHGSASPRMKDFPRSLLPSHRNVERALNDGLFADRFRVQVAGNPSATVTSHIHKDGHYFIHFDPVQARSFTVREAARAQTFPDSYVFLGPRTEQFRQVGNAVPPYIAAQIADIVFDVLRQAKRV
jgi:DNA (cytosine-5)-methyltransferase 1